MKLCSRISHFQRLFCLLTHHNCCSTTHRCQPNPTPLTKIPSGRQSRESQIVLITCSTAAIKIYKRFVFLFVGRPIGSPIRLTLSILIEAAPSRTPSKWQTPDFGKLCSAYQDFVWHKSTKYGGTSEIGGGPSSIILESSSSGAGLQTSHFRESARLKSRLPLLPPPLTIVIRLLTATSHCIKADQRAIDSY